MTHMHILLFAQFYDRCVAPLPNKFQQKYIKAMPQEYLNEAKNQINELCSQSKRSVNMGHESVKNTFLGGMRDGESWGLRRWLSKNGGALKICNDLELIFQALQKLDKEAETTILLAKELRPIATSAYKQLKKMVPQAYQEVSSAHPYLPFFHRLESALSGLSNFDPEDDDVIIIDDENEIKEAKQTIKPKSKEASKKRKHMQQKVLNQKKNKNLQEFVFQQADSVRLSMQMKLAGHNRKKEDADSNECEIICVKTSHDQLPAAQPLVPLQNGHFTLNARQPNVSAKGASLNTHTRNVRKRIIEFSDIDTGPVMNFKIRELAYEYGRGPQRNCVQFWNQNDNYVFALDVFASFLNDPKSKWFIDPIDEEGLVKQGLPTYRDVIVNPLCFRDIFDSLLYSWNNGDISANLKTTKLGWDMWEGSFLLQAVDLVLLNSLAYYGKDRSVIRVDTLSMRNKLWSKILSRVGRKGREFVPTKRGENSGFIVYKT